MIIENTMSKIYFIDQFSKKIYKNFNDIIISDEYDELS